MFDPYILFSLLAVGVLGASGVLWGTAIMRLATGRTLLRCEPRPSVPWGMIDLLILIGLYIGTIIAASAVFRGLQIKAPLDEQATPDDRFAWVAVQAVLPLLITGLALAIVALRHRCSAADLGFRLRDVGRDVLIGAGAFVMIAPPVFLIQAILTQFVPYEHDLIELVKKDPRLLLLSGVSAMFVAPLCEELQFRVLLQGWLEKISVWRGDSLPLFFGGRPLETDGAETDDAETGLREFQGEEETTPAEDEHLAGDAASDTPAWPTAANLNPYAPPLATSHGKDEEPPPGKPSDHSAISPTPHWWPIPISACIFAAMHAGQGAAPIPLFVLALGLGFVYRQTHRVLPSITVHLLLNATTMLVLYLSIYFPPPK